MNTKALIKKFKSKSLILRPKTLNFLKNNWPELSTPENLEFMEKLVQMSSKYLQEKGSRTNIVEEEVARIIFSEISRQTDPSGDYEKIDEESSDPFQKIQPKKNHIQTELGMRFKKLKNSVVLATNFQQVEMFSRLEAHPFNERGEGRYEVEDSSQKSDLGDLTGELKNMINRREKAEKSDTGLGRARYEFENSSKGERDLEPEEDEAMSRGMSWRGVELVYNVLDNPNSHKSFLKSRYNALLHHLKLSYNFGLSNHHTVAGRESIASDYQNEILFTEMNRFFDTQYEELSIQEIFKKMKTGKKRVLSEIGSVFGVSGQKSLVGFINEKKNQFWLEGPYSEVLLDLVYCRKSYGYIMKGMWVCVTGVLKNGKFVVFEVSLPNTGMILDDNAMEEVESQ